MHASARNHLMSMRELTCPASNGKFSLPRAEADNRTNATFLTDIEYTDTLSQHLYIINNFEKITKALLVYIPNNSKSGFLEFTGLPPKRTSNNFKERMAPNTLISHHDSVLSFRININE